MAHIWGIHRGASASQRADQKPSPVEDGEHQRYALPKVVARKSKSHLTWPDAYTQKHSGIWSQRQVILTKSLLLIAKIDTNVISESIPLHQIDRVAIVSETGMHQTRGGGVGERDRPHQGAQPHAAHAHMHALTMKAQAETKSSERSKQAPLMMISGKKAN